MTDMQCGSQALTTYLAELKDNGFITIVRRGQGKTNIYYLTEVVQPAPIPQELPNTAEQSSSLKIKEQELWKSKTEKYEADKYPDRYPSSTRKPENSGHDYVNSHATPNEPQDSTKSTHQTRVEQYRNHSTPTARNVENIEPQKEKAPAREIRHDLYEDITRGLLLAYMSDFASEFNDQAPLQSSITRAYHLYQQSGLTMDAFTTYLYTARAVTKERTASIRKYTERGVKTKMAYFFAVLEDRLGLRHPTQSIHASLSL